LWETHYSITGDTTVTVSDIQTFFVNNNGSGTFTSLREFKAFDANSVEIIDSLDTAIHETFHNFTFQDTEPYEYDETTYEGSMNLINTGITEFSFSSNDGNKFTNNTKSILMFMPSVSWLGFNLERK
jgi:hypothetical protein|tara:strand:- start:4285 stop:4665 length:381 start_codon:yes stop_codon:yes gene_type:complete